MLPIILKLRDVQLAVRAQHQVTLGAAWHPSDLLRRGDHPARGFASSMLAQLCRSEGVLLPNCNLKRT